MPTHVKTRPILGSLSIVIAAVIYLDLTDGAAATNCRVRPVPGAPGNVAETTICSGDKCTWKNPFRVRTLHETKIVSIIGRMAQAYPNMGTDGSLDVRADLGGAFTPTPAGDTAVSFQVVDDKGGVTGSAILIIHVINTVPPCRRPPRLG